MTPEQEYRYDICAIGAHPDDVEHSIGGTLLRQRDMGKSICILHMTHGESGTFGSAEERDNEARAAAEYIGADVRWLDFPDAQIMDSYDARLKVIHALRDIRPRLLMCQYYEYPLMHPDHEATGQIVRGAFRLCRFKNIDTGQEPFWIPNIAYYLFPHHVRSSFVIDTTDYFDRWLELAAKYETQFPNIPGYKERLISHKRAAGAQIDALYGEAFYCDRPLKASHVDLTLL